MYSIHLAAGIAGPTGKSISRNTLLCYSVTSVQTSRDALIKESLITVRSESLFVNREVEARLNCRFSCTQPQLSSGL
jgi:hypothetical protein